MVTKESLIEDREKANVAFLKLKQLYNKSSDSVFLIVEGKDDVAFYTCICLRYAKFVNAEIIPANNRRNVISTYDALDWSVYSTERVFFFVDRDLSDITNEYTPQAPNVYVSDSYSIENSLFDQSLLITAIKVIYGVVDLSGDEISEITRLYNQAYGDFLSFFIPIMSWILNWRISGNKCNLNNLNDGISYRINQGRFEIVEGYQIQETVVNYIHTACSVAYITQDINSYTRMIEQHGGIEKNIRGKYLKTFFVKFFNSIRMCFSTLFPGRSNPKPVVTIGASNALPLLCGYMTTPNSLSEFMSQKSTKEQLSLPSI